MRHADLFLQRAQTKNIQFKFDKSQFALPKVDVLGFRVGCGERSVQQSKVDAMRNWPGPKGCDDVVSFLAFVNFLREFVPTFHEHAQYLKPYTKKGASFKDWANDQPAQAAFRALRESLASDAVLVSPDYTAAADPEGSGRGFELWVDASEYAWGCVLAQRGTPGGVPRPIAAYGRPFSSTESAWSAWGRELFAFRDSLAATDHLQKGFLVTAFTDHRNNLFTGNMKGNKRVNKKILRWSLDSEEYGDRINLRWVKGVDNVLADAISRNPKDRGEARERRMPGGPG